MHNIIKHQFNVISTIKNNDNEHLALERANNDIKLALENKNSNNKPNEHLKSEDSLRFEIGEVKA